MNGQFSVAQILLWLFVIALGIEIGAGLYETLVVLPLWVTAPPDSVIAYYQHNAADPQFAVNAGPRFWMVQTPLVGVFGAAALISGLRSRAEHRRWRIRGTILALIVVISTFAWFVPNIMRLTGDGVMTMTREEITSTTNWWVRLNWVRIVVYSSGWLCALRALTIPSKAAGGK